MHGVELAISRVVGVQVEAVQSVSITLGDCQLPEDAGLAWIAVEIEIYRQLLRLFVEDVQGSVEIADEQALRVHGFFAEGIHSRQQQLVRALAVHQSGHRHDQEVFDVQRCLARPDGSRSQTRRESEPPEARDDLHDVSLPCTTYG